MQPALAPSLLLLSEFFSFSTSIVRALQHSSGSRFRAYKVSRGNRGSYYYPYTSSLFPCKCMVHIHLPFSPPHPLPLPFAFVEETSPSATTFSAWQTRSARACCDFYSLAFYFCFSSSSPTVLSRSSPPLLSPFFLHFLSIRSHSSLYLSLSLSVFVCPPLCVGLVIQTDTLLLSSFASSSR